MGIVWSHTTREALMYDSDMLRADLTDRDTMKIVIKIPSF